MSVGSLTFRQRAVRRFGASPIDDEVAARFEVLEAGSADDIRQRIKRGTRAPQAGPELVLDSTAVGSENEARIRANADELARELNEAMVTLVIEDPRSADAIVRFLEPIQAHLRERAAAAREKAERLEHALEGGRTGLGQLLAGLRFRPGEMIGPFRRMQQVLEAQRTNLAAEILRAASGVTARALAQATVLGNQRNTLGATIARARELADAEIAALTQRLDHDQMLDDLPPGAVLHLARAVASEPPELLRPQVLAVVATAMTEMAEPVSAEVLLERVRLESIPPQGLAPQSVEAAVGMIARQLDTEPQRLWRWTLEELGCALKRAPAVPLARSGERHLQAYLFQVLPPGQSPVAAANEEVRLAFFQGAEPRARLGLAGFVTNFELADVEPVRELRDELTRAAAIANPFILPHRARAADPPHEEPGDPRDHEQDDRPDSGPNGGGPATAAQNAVPAVGPVSPGSQAS